VFEILIGFMLFPPKLVAGIAALQSLCWRCCRRPAILRHGRPRFSLEQWRELPTEVGLSARVRARLRETLCFEQYVSTAVSNLLSSPMIGFNSRGRHLI
jgi:hypothetical protein